VPFPIEQTSLSVSKRRGTLRGMHFQLPPSREGKLVTCVRGRIFDVALDLRPRSRSFLRHFGVELKDDEPRSLFIPPGCAHGFLTLTDDCAILYMMTDFYEPTLSTGVRWNDPAFGIAWPEQPTEVLDRDATYPDFDPRTVDGFADY
jgi:dTDP-4-dehydrorhamnose 3,5-epimerase